MDADFRRRGVARALKKAILDEAGKQNDIHTVVPVITGGNEASFALHREFGFVHCGTIREVGEKFDRMLDIDNFQLML